MKLLRKVGSTSQMIYVFIADSTSTTGAGKTGLVFNTAGLVWTYAKSDDGNVAGTAVTLATMTRGTWATGGFIEKDATLLPGVYQLSIPNVVLSSGTHAVMVLRGATGMADCRVEIQLTGVDLDSAATFMTGVNGVAPPTNWNLTSVDASGRLDIIKVAGTTQTARDLGLQLDATITSRMATYTQPTGFLAATFPAGTVANTTNITAGIMTTTTNVTNVSTGGIVAASFAVGAIDGVAFSVAAGNVAADAVLGRNVAGGSSTGRLVKEALYTLRNKSSISGTVATFTLTDDVTTAFTANIVTTAGNPITSFAPTS